MILIKKLAPRRWSRAIVALAIRSGNKVMQAVQPDQIIDRNQNDDVRPRSGVDCSPVQLRKQTTVTVETETLMVVRSERRSSRLLVEASDEISHSPIGNEPEPQRSKRSIQVHEKE